MEKAFERGESSVNDWIKSHHSDYSAGDLKAGLKEGNPSAASFMKFQAFTTATVQDQRIRTRMQAALAGNLKRGEGGRPFRQVIDQEFEKAGLTKLAPHQIENIYVTNTSLVFGIGQMNKLIQVSDDFPYWKYSATLDSKTRADHRALHGKIFRTGDFTFWPPIGFRCRCTGIPLTARQAGRYLKADMPNDNERRQLLDNTGNAEFLGNKQENYMKWLAKEYEKADAPARKLLDKAFDQMKSEIDSLQKEGLKVLFDNKYINKTWDKFLNNEACTVAAQANGLATNQAFYVYAYTDKAPLYNELNSWLFKNQSPVDFSKSQLLTMKRKLSGTLKKLPKHQGTVYRNIKDLPADILKQYKEGNTIVWDGFSSASTEPRHFVKNRYKFEIESKNSRYIAPLSRFQGQKETLFLPGSKFKVLNRKEKGNVIYFKLREV